LANRRRLIILACGPWLRGCFVAVAVGVVCLSSAQAAEWRKAAASERQVAPSKTPDWAYLVAGKSEPRISSTIWICGSQRPRYFHDPDDGNVHLTDISSIVLWDELTRRGGSGGRGKFRFRRRHQHGVVKAHNRIGFHRMPEAEACPACGDSCFSFS